MCRYRHDVQHAILWAGIDFLCFTCDIIYYFYFMISIFWPSCRDAYFSLYPINGWMKQVNQNTKSIYRQSIQTLGTPLEYSSFTTSKLNRQHLNTSIRLTTYAPHTVILMAVCTERVQSHKQVIMALNTSTPFELLARSKWSAPREDN